VYACWVLNDDAPELAQPELPGAFRLVAGVLRQAARDLKSQEARHKEDALAFFRGYRGSLAWWAEILGVQPEKIRRMAGAPSAEPNAGPSHPATRTAV
jgi:hypothetical protein